MGEWKVMLDGYDMRLALTGRVEVTANQTKGKTS